MADNEKKPRAPLPHAFKAGNPGGPGRPKLPYSKKESDRRFNELRGIASLEIQERFEKYRVMPIDELMRLKEERKVTGDDWIIINGIISSGEKLAGLEEIIKLRTIAAGPEPKQVELSGKDGQPLNPLFSISPDELLATWRKLQREIKERECQQTQSSPQLLESRLPLLVGELLEKKSDD